METKQFLHELDDAAVARVIGDAERKTSGEIRVFVSELVVTDPVAEGKKEFVSLGMTKTAQRNGVLIFVAPRSQTYSIVGDEAVHKKYGPRLWEELTERMMPLLKAGKYTEAIVTSVEHIGEALSKEFPFLPGDRNELPNTIARRKPEE